MAVDIIESGLQGYRIEWVRENTIGTIPATPTFKLFGDVVLSEDWTPDAAITPLRGIGDADPDSFERGPETHDFNISYYLQHTISDGVDPSYDGIARNSDNRLPNSHTIVVRRNENTGGDDSNGLREYVVLQGAKINQVELPGDPGSAEPIMANLEYMAMKGRKYQIHQPSTATTVSAVSSTSVDTSISVTIESAGGTKSETVQLNATSDSTNPVPTSTTFPDIDAVWLSGEAVGNITVKNGATTLATIYGKGEYDSIEGDRGVPPVGSTGSHPSALNLSYEKFLDDSISRPAGTDLAFAINSLTFRVNNNISRQPQANSLQQRLLDGIRVTEVDATVYGEEELYDKVTEHLRVTANNIVWNLTRTNIQVDSAVLRDPGSQTIEAESAMATLDNTFEGEGVTLS